MKSLTIHNIDNTMMTLLKETAKRKSISINQYVKNLIENAIGFKKDTTPKFLNEFKEFSGIWSQEEHKEFDKKVKDFEKIDKEEWK